MGGGLVVNGAVITGANAVSGEWGHTPLPLDDRRRISRRSVLLRSAGLHRDLCLGTGIESAFAQQTGQKRNAAQIAEAARAGDRDAGIALNRFEDQLARALTMLINVIDPDVIVLGGGLSNIALLYENLPAKVAHYAFSDAVHTPIVQAVHGDSGGVRGRPRSGPITHERAARRDRIRRPVPQLQCRTQSGCKSL